MVVQAEELVESVEGDVPEVSVVQLLWVQRLVLLEGWVVEMQEAEAK